MRSAQTHVSTIRIKNAAANSRAVWLRKNGTNNMGDKIAAIHDNCAAYVMASPAPIHSAANPVSAVDCMAISKPMGTIIPCTW